MEAIETLRLFPASVTDIFKPGRYVYTDNHKTAITTIHNNDSQ
jgi:hypothetical protein